MTQNFVTVQEKFWAKQWILVDPYNLRIKALKKQEQGHILIQITTKPILIHITPSFPQTYTVEPLSKMTTSQSGLKQEVVFYKG